LPKPAREKRDYRVPGGSIAGGQFIGVASSRNSADPHLPSSIYTFSSSVLKQLNGASRQLQGIRRNRALVCLPLSIFH
jgi:hypothetical protein